MEVLQTFWSLLNLCLLLTLESLTVDALAGSKYCGACRALLNDAEWAIQTADPNERIQVGGFRVDSKGNQKIKEKKFARSETHLLDVFDGICEKQTHYGEVTNEDGSKEIVRMKDHAGRMLKTRHLDLDRSAGTTLKNRCSDFLEDFEEEVIALLQKEGIPNYEEAICVQETRVCKMEEIAKPLRVLPEVTFDEASDSDDLDTGDDEDDDEDEDDYDNADDSDEEKEKNMDGESNDSIHDQEVEKDEL